MRSCMYCGKELGEGEVCDCSQAAAHRAKADSRKETSYKTGYAGTDSRFERARTRYNTRRAARKNEPFKDNFAGYIGSALKSPVDTVLNPPRIGRAAMLLIAAAMGAFLWLCVFFILRGGGIRITRLIAGVMGFRGSEGLKTALSIPVVLLSGAVGGIIIFFVYMGVFYLINRFIMRMKTPFWEFCARLVTAWIPFTLICIFGAVVSILSPVTILALLACGVIITAALTYEALKTEWVSYPASKVLYAMLLGCFVLIAFITHIVLI